MASVKVNTNLKQVNDVIQARIKAIANPETVLRPLCFDLIDLMTKRIHIDGLASDGQPIGTYSNGYLKLRQTRYNRSADKKVIVSLTRQLENNWSVIATPKGFGIGFLNPFNYQKARWVEQIKQREIFSLTDLESNYAISFINEKTAETLND